MTSTICARTSETLKDGQGLFNAAGASANATTYNALMYNIHLVDINGAMSNILIQRATMINAGLSQITMAGPRKRSSRVCL